MVSASHLKELSSKAKFGRTRLWLRHFRKDESGGLVIFALMLAVLMLMMGGIAVDLMRYESRRTSLQNTLDRSTLAAAALNQTMVPREVVDDYFLKAGLSDFLTSVTVTQGLNYRRVTATAEADTQPMFMHMMGIDEFDAPGISQAEQKVNNVEIMLILDVSGSMNSNSRLTNLKTAAKQFVSTVLTGDTEHKISIGLVPFNGQVNLGAPLVAQLNAVYPSGTADVNCIDLPVSAYDSATISQYAWATTLSPTELSLSAHADTFDTYGTVAPNAANRWCPPQPGNVVRMPSQNIATLQGYIDGLTAIGATSINAGMKWGLGLLDPESRQIYSAMIQAGTAEAAIEGRPYDYDDNEAMKVIVLMTDGEHFAEQRMNDAYKSGLSPIYRSDMDNVYSIYHASRSGTAKYYVPTSNTWRTTAWTNSAGTGTATQQTWPQVWAALNMQYVACYFYSVPVGSGSCSSSNTAYQALLATFRSTTSTGSMDTQLQSVCDLAKANNIIVYGIAFEASANGQTQIRNCSTNAETGSHYFDATGLQISTAFSAIANNISQLRLTQ